MRLRKTPRAAIFDLDGVLLDTEPLYTQATRHIAARFGKNFDWELKRQTMGGNARNGARLVIDTLALPLDVDQYLSERFALLLELFRATTPIPGAPAWIEVLRQLGLPIAVGTSSERRLCDVKWASHSWLRDLDPKVCGDDPEVRHTKPEPDIFLVAAAKLGVDPAECVVFEDSPAGVTAARAAGMQVIVIKAAELDAHHVSAADLIVDGYHQLSPQQLGFGD